MEKTKIAIIGLGGIAQLAHLPILTKLPNVQVVSIADTSRTRLKVVGEKYAIESQYQDYREMLAKEEIHGVVIATPTDSHAEIAVNCLKAKKDILIEKPIARNLEEAKTIQAAAKKNKKQVMVGMKLRYRPDAMLMRSLVNSGELGDIFYIRCGWLRKQSSEQKWFLNKSQSGGGVLIDLGILVLDLALWIMNDHKLKSVSVETFSHTTKDVEDTAVGLVRFSDERVISFEVSWGLHAEWDKFHLAAFGTKGTAHLNPLKAYKRLESGHIDYTLPTSATASNLYKKAFENELKHFVAAVRDNSPMVSSGEDALMLMQLLEAIYKSAELKKEVML
ncbi:MAG: dehydrogenase [Stygiobacter sp. RIFOXYA12_FULL_38_9]|nr:MAG: oxidoreductase domain-containing protein [Stygiobacter sp.]KAF0213110.1 MAG: oxidoreductase domain-containing [Ignavibacteria bacterium]OGU69453.1 MAG: dehydrogenase [Stygiobacter sp. GWC2_38_9]OGU77272.1 MAG: dehydrogenase [Stygiobacter sp. RIFOXYA12_FULL_38_9]OGV08995.1 MAG: dehydrogenase [Stygiobacter sp. RIFOXYB2_FULL_37_11]OGV14188.1 MAG: dehydrogenase [Stygiobacter sp. RIFOXYA2_FULL_38_8]OGV16219.1 MAG: dehydrogenase [Stygiobacter sp. RIFOXYC2_FULL_38_25]OGV81687.1 MAG: dehydro